MTNEFLRVLCALCGDSTDIGHRVSRFESSRSSDASRLTSPVSRFPIHHPN